MLKKGEMKMLERSTCRENGINPRAVYDFLKACNDKNIGLDSFMLLKNGKVVSEAYHAPYNKDTTHVLYSMSKSFTATALGFAVAEGKVSLSDSVSDFFPEYDRFGRSKKVTVRHLVTMTAGKMVPMAAARRDRDWIKIFFDAPLIAKPGSLYMYTNDNFYMLSAIISRVYGETLVDFLYPRLFEPLGIKKPVWEVDKFGYAAGGWGLYMPIEDQAKVLLCYSRGGVYEGKQVIPAEWVKQATAYQVPTIKRGQIDVQKGYGYGFWRSSLPCTYRAYGLHGQNGYVFEGKDTVLMVNCGISKDKYLCAEINRLYRRLWDEGTNEDEELLKNYAAGFGDKDDLPASARNFRLEDELCDTLLTTHSTMFGSMLHATMTAVMNDEIGKIDCFRLHKDENGDMYLSWTEGGFTNKIKLGLNNEYERTEITLANIKYHANAKAAWTKGKVFTVYIRIEEGCHLRVLEFDFSGKVLIVRNTSFPDLPNLAVYYLDFAGFPLPPVLEDVLVKYVAPAVMLVGEPNFRVKIN